MMKHKELLKCRVGFRFSHGDGWIQLCTLYADWPLGRLVVTEDQLTLSAGFVGTPVSVPFASIVNVSRLWPGLRIQFRQDNEPHEVTLHGWFLIDQLTECVKAHQLPLDLP